MYIHVWILLKIKKLKSKQGTQINVLFLNCQIKMYIWKTIYDLPDIFGIRYNEWSIVIIHYDEHNTL